MLPNNVSRISAIAVAVLLAFSLSACSGSGGGSHSTAKNNPATGSSSGSDDGSGTPRAMAVRAATDRAPERVQVPGQALAAERVLVQGRDQVQAQAQAQEAVEEPLPQA